MLLDKVLELGRSVLAGKQEENKQAEAEANKNAEKKTPEKEEQSPNEEIQKNAEQIAADERAEAEEESLLEKADDELSEEEKAKRAEVEEKRNGEPVDKKLSRAQRKMEKRIGKLTGQRKDLERQLDNERKENANNLTKMQERLDVLEAPKVQNDYDKAEQLRIGKYAEDDKALPIEQRREMTKEAWEEWHDDDPLAAQRWVQKNEARRGDERKADEDKDNASKTAEKFIASQDKSVNRMTDRFPNARPTERATALKNEGKNAEEIHNILSAELPEYRICDDVVKENPDWMNKENFGDLVAEEMTKRLKAINPGEPKDIPKTYTEEELQAKIEEARNMEGERRSRVDNSNGSTKTPTITKVPKNRDEKVEQLEKIYEKAGLDPKKGKVMGAADRLKYRSEQGYGNFNPSDEDD